MSAQAILVLIETALRFGPEAMLAAKRMLQKPEAVTDADVDDLASKMTKTMADYYAEARAAIATPPLPAPEPPSNS